MTSRLHSLLKAFRNGSVRSVLLLMAFAVASVAAHPALHPAEIVNDAAGGHSSAPDDCPLHLDGTAPVPPDCTAPLALLVPLPDSRMPVPEDAAPPRDPELSSRAIPRAPPSL